MRFQIAVLFLLLAIPVFADGPPSNNSEGSFIRIQANSIVTSNSVQSAEITILYNYPSTGLPAEEEAESRITVHVNSVLINQNEVNYVKPGVFSVEFTPAMLGLGGQELPDGPYWANASVTENLITYRAFEPKAIIVLERRTPIPETDVVAVAFFLLLSLLVMRWKGK